jgi:hypothetical protein
MFRPPCTLATKSRTEERPETPAIESEETAAERRRSEARMVKDWTVQQNGPHFAVPPSLPETELMDRSTEDESEDPAADGPQEPLVLGNGLSKLAAWENEIRQFSPPEESQDEDLTEEQRAAREELERDQKARERELNDRLLQQRADLERERINRVIANAPLDRGYRRQTGRFNLPDQIPKHDERL